LRRTPDINISTGFDGETFLLDGRSACGSSRMSSAWWASVVAQLPIPTRRYGQPRREPAFYSGLSLLYRYSIIHNQCLLSGSLFGYAYHHERIWLCNSLYVNVISWSKKTIRCLIYIGYYLEDLIMFYYGCSKIDKFNCA